MSYDKSDTRIDCVSWLECRRVLSERLLHEDDAVGRLSGAALSFVGRVGNIRNYVKNALVECKIFNDSLTTCSLEFVKAQVQLKSGKNPQTILEKLRVSYGCRVLYNVSVILLRSVIRTHLTHSGHIIFFFFDNQIK